jgi:hypothetical protein
MTRYALVRLLFGFLAWGLAASSQSPIAAQQPAVQATATTETTARDQSRVSGSSTIAVDKPLITIAGLCHDPSADKTADSGCRTVITQDQFEKVINAVQPGMSARARREFALRYADALVMTRKAEQMGLDKGAKYDEQMKIARIEVLSRELKRVLQEKASQVSDKDIDDYYRNNIASFEKAEVDRIYVPKNQQPPSNSDQGLSVPDRQKGSQQSERTMKEEADNLRARAVGGEEFVKLQAEAYRVAGIKSAAPNTSIEVRRASLPPTQVVVMDLKPGDVSSVLADPNGYVIYGVKTKETLSLDQAREEIKATLRSQRMQEEMRGIQDSATPTLDESYFRRSQPPLGTTATGEPAKAAANPHSSNQD